jgi:hypothetical protein
MFSFLHKLSLRGMSIDCEWYTCAHHRIPHGKAVGDKSFALVPLRFPLCTS